jgi:alpha-N-arabinofuranosidase
MRMMDRNLELVACGSSNSRMPTFAAWEAEVLAQTYDQVDFVSLHAYYEPVDGDVGSFLASNVDMDRMIEAVVVTADHIGAKLRSPKKIMLSFDEWNVWYQSRFHGTPVPEDWPVAPRQLEDRYDVTDAVVVGSLLISLLRHSDRVTSAAQAQLVNVIAPIMTEPAGPAWRQTIFHPFALTSRFARGDVLRMEPSSPRYETARFGDVPVLDSVATWDGNAREATVLAVNRDQVEPLVLEVDVRALPVAAVREGLTLADDDRAACNTAEQPDRVVPRPNTTAELVDGRLRVELPPVSWSMLRLGPAV